VSRLTADGLERVAVLGAVAEFERELIRERTGEGRKRAWRPIRPAAPPGFPPASRSHAAAAQRIAVFDCGVVSSEC
jgi:DNA invertase Pin-like site-specific DNA recombinase